MKKRIYVKIPSLVEGNCKIGDDEWSPAPRHAPIRLGHGLAFVSHVTPLQIAPISPSLRIYPDALRIRIHMKIRTSLRELRRGDGISRWSPRLFPRVLPVWGSLLPILTHMGLGRRAHLGIRHMVNMGGFVIWLESGGEHPGADMSKNKKRIDLSHRGPPL